MKDVVDFQAAKIEAREAVKLKGGLRFELSGERAVEVHEVAGGSNDGAVCIRIFRPTLDGKVSKLVFGLQPDAGDALLLLLSELKRKRQ